jgi:hypothetical protein
MGQHTPSGSRPPGAIDFELTDLSAARSVLDDLPEGVLEVERLQPGYWEARRRKPVPSDRALTGAAMDWLIRLPAQVRPQALVEQFPRVVNAIAQVWSDPAAGPRAMARLLTDDRGGRRGFPPEVERELRQLADYRKRGL